MKKISELSFMNVILCLLVVFIHVASDPVSLLIKGSVPHALVFIPWRLSTFVVQGFVFLSGLKMFFNISRKRHFSYGRYYWSKIKNIIIPYVIIVYVFYGYFVNEGYFEANHKDVIMYILKGDLCAHFYFIIAIVQFYALAPLWRWMVDNARVHVAIPVSLAVTVLCGQYLPDVMKIVFNGYDFAYNDRVFTTYLFYWVCGCYAGNYYNEFKATLSDKKIIKASVTMFLVVAAADVILGYMKNIGMFGFSQLENLHILYSISAILILFVVSVKIAEGAMEFGIFKAIDRASFYVYLIHPLFIFIVNTYIAKWGIINVDTAFIIRAFVTYTFSIIICHYFIKFKNWIMLELLKSVYGE